MSQPHFEASVKMRFTLPKVGTWSPLGLPPAISEFNCRGQNTSAWGVLYTIGKALKCRCWKWPRMSHSGICSTSYGRKKGRNQIGSLTPDHKKSRIDPISVCAGGVRHTVRKLLRRATSFLWTSSQPEVWGGSYELPKSRESKSRQFRNSSLGVPGIKAIWMRVWWSNIENTIWGKVVASLESGPWWVKWVRVAYGLS
jgi:hypothetical protein